MTKKILIYMNSDISQFGVIKKIQEKRHDVEFYAIIDVTNKPKKFFEMQKFVNFKKIWFYHDHIQSDTNFDMNYLEDFEKKYSISLWDLIYSDRIFLPFNEFYNFKSNEILSILYSSCKFIENIFDEIQPEIFLTSSIFFHHEFLLYHMCQKKSVLPLILRGTRFANKTMITEHFEFVNQGNHKASVARSMDELLSLKEDHHVYKRSIMFRDTFLNSKSHLIKAAFSYIFKNKNTNLKSHYTYYGRKKFNVVLNSLYDRLRIFYRKKFIDRTLIKNPAMDQKFIFFPLHQEQEASLLTFAPHYADQMNVIKNIAKSLPIGYKLYVKEHPLQKIRSWRKVSFYQELINLPNVKVIHPDTNSTNLMRNCKMVITISGTSALESSFYNKPSIIFSDVMFTHLSWITRLNSFENLNKTINSCLNHSVNIDELNNYVDYILKNSFDFDNDTFSIASQEIFHHGGFLVDTEINDIQMKKFLSEFDDEFEKISQEILKKIP